MTYVVALACVLGIAGGQLLFKLSADAMRVSGNHFDLRGLAILGVALLLYGVTTLAWVWVLQKLSLGRAYPLMALAFVFVPIGSHFLFGESFHWQYFVGVGLIVLGIIVSVQA